MSSLICTHGRVVSQCNYIFKLSFQWIISRTIFCWKSCFLSVFREAMTSIFIHPCELNRLLKTWIWKVESWRFGSLKLILWINYSRCHIGVFHNVWLFTQYYWFKNSHNLLISWYIIYAEFSQFFSFILSLRFSYLRFFFIFCTWNWLSLIAVLSL